MSVLRRGGSSAIADLTRGLLRGGRCVLFKLLRCIGCSLFSSVSACASRASVKALASSLNSDRATVQLFARTLVNASWLIGNWPMLAPRCIPLLGDFGDRNSPCSAGLGDVPLPRPLILSFCGLSGLVDVDGGMLTVRSCGGRGEMGTFSRKHSSGTSSPSSSSHSFSNSFADFLSRFDCQLPLLAFSELVERL